MIPLIFALFLYSAVLTIFAAKVAYEDIAVGWGVAGAIIATIGGFSMLYTALYIFLESGA